MVSKVDELRDRVLGSIQVEAWCHYVDELIDAVRAEVIEGTAHCPECLESGRKIRRPGAETMGLFWVCELCGFIESPDGK